MYFNQFYYDRYYLDMMKIYLLTIIIIINEVNFSTTLIISLLTQQFLQVLK